MDQALEVKKVPFLGTELVAARDAEGQIWAGVKWMCDGIGLSEGQTKAERLKIQTDEVLSASGRNFVLNGTGYGNREVLCLKLNAVPLWLAKISVTPVMRTEHPELADRLKQYQLKAQDVLAAAFLPEAVTSVTPAAVRPTEMPPFGELARFLGVVVRVMKDNQQPPEVISDTVKSICAQGGVDLPPNFVKRPPFQQFSFTGLIWGG